MINLLPDERKVEVRAGRTNVLLVRYLTIFGGAVGLLAITTLGVFFVLTTTQQAAQAKVNQSEQQVRDYQSIKKESDEFRSNLATAKSILDGDTSYSSLIYDIADVIPRNVILDNLSLDSQTLGSKATMDASAKSYQDAVRLKEVFIQNPSLFSDVYFETLTSGEESATEPYPVKVKLSVIIKKESLR